jgi:hypothetical protein
MINVKDIQFAFKLSPSLAKLLMIMLEETLVTTKEVSDKYKIATDGRVAMYRLRNYLRGYDIEIMSRRELGYWLEPSTKQKVIDLADVGQMSFTFDHEVEEDVRPSS